MTRKSVYCSARQHIERLNQLETFSHAHPRPCAAFNIAFSIESPWLQIDRVQMDVRRWKSMCKYCARVAAIGAAHIYTYIRIPLCIFHAFYMYRFLFFDKQEVNQHRSISGDAKFAASLSGPSTSSPTYTICKLDRERFLDVAACSCACVCVQAYIRACPYDVGRSESVFLQSNQTFTPTVNNIMASYFAHEHTVEVHDGWR